MILFNFYQLVRYVINKQQFIVTIMNGLLAARGGTTTVDHTKRRGIQTYNSLTEL